jgi:hypothetical protein
MRSAEPSVNCTRIEHHNVPFGVHDDSNSHRASVLTPILPEPAGEWMGRVLSRR